jgi:hypothetical protein
MNDEKLIYVPGFLTQQNATELYDYIRNNLPFVRQRNDRQAGKYALRRMSYPGFAPNPEVYRKASQRENSGGTIIDAPPLYQDLSSAATAFAGGDWSYASTIAYQRDDFMKPHQHNEDRKRADQRVIVLSLGAVHPVRISYGATVKTINPTNGRLQEKFMPNGFTETILPAHGSIYLLPTRFNQAGSRGEAQHAVLPGDENGLRISINMKNIPLGLSQEDFDEACSRRAGRSNSQSGSLYVREPGPPRIYDCHTGKKYPDDAVYVGREVRSRQTGKVEWPRTPYGNHKKLNGQDWINETERLMRDPEFAAKMREDLRGKDLLCWCKPGEPNCHARRWLELASK